MTLVAIDVSGLAWNYRTGVQNLYWAFVNAYAKNGALQNVDVHFYDRSGLFNKEIFRLLADHYQSVAPSWWPEKLQSPLKILCRLVALATPELEGMVNHVWNWDIYHPRGARGSITIPDILPLEYPHWFTKNFQNCTKKSLVFARDEAEFVFCISKYIKSRLVEAIGIPAERIKVVYPGIEAHYFDRVQPDEELKILNRYSLVKQQFLLSSGFLDPRKNLTRQLEAFGIFAQRSRSSLKYALTGLKTSLSSDVLELIEKPNLRDRVIFLGYVSPIELKILMGASKALMYCSLAEGFGLPIIEAMAAGTQVITSNNTSMLELADGRALLVSPNETDDIVRAIEEIANITEQSLSDSIEKNREFARGFTIEKWFDGHLSAYVK